MPADATHEARPPVVQDAGRTCQPSLAKAPCDIVYQCPGEQIPIARATHLARLASGYQACRRCVHRHEPGHLLTQEMQALREHEPTSASLFTPDGIRGTYCNEITRPTLSRVAMAVARIFWEEANPDRMTRLPKFDLSPAPDLRLRRQRRAHGLDEAVEVEPLPPAYQPELVVGHDSRISSPELALGVANTLRLWGCCVYDTGCQSRPEFEFAVSQLQAVGGVYITGGVEPAERNGLDVVDGLGWDWTLRHDWERVESLLQHEVERPVRSAGHLTSESTRAAYLDSLQPLFKGLRPLRIAVGCVDPHQARLLPQLLEAFPGELLVYPIRRHFGGRTDPPDALADDLHELLRSEELDAGMLMGSDGRACYLMDERGEVLLPEQALRVLQFGSFPEATTDHCGRYRLTPGRSTCDAIRTLARLLQSLSRSDCPMSWWLR